VLLHTTITSSRLAPFVTEVIPVLQHVAYYVCYITEVSMHKTAPRTKESATAPCSSL